MKRAFRRTLQVALTTFVATATMGVFAATASASDNTWIKSPSGGGVCITTQGGSGITVDGCRWGDKTQLWRRVGSRIVKAYSNQCLDSDNAGTVYYGECNGGNYQNWDYTDAGSGYVHVKNRQTGRYLTYVSGAVRTDPNDYSAAWQFYSGE